MKNKFIPIIIIVIAIIIMIIAIISFNILSNNSENTNKKTSTQLEVENVYITLNKEVSKEENSQVIITVYASTEEENGIKEIILPNGRSFSGDTTTYTVAQNGTYEFKAISNSGVTATKQIEVTEIVEASAINPYIPEGFSVVEDSIEDGFVIEDVYENQYVWIPAENGKLTRDTATDTNYEDTDSTASALVNSVSKYYGFYLGRYEASQCEIDGNIAVACMSGKNPWTNITYLDAVEYASRMGEAFEYKDCHTALINSYAWDTALKWINKSYTNFSSNTNYGNYSGTIYPTGYTESDNVKNICDLAGNVREWTTEIYKGTTTGSSSSSSKNKQNDIIQRVVRGGGANLSRTPASHIYYPENLADNYWGFRVILYK